MYVYSTSPAMPRAVLTLQWRNVYQDDRREHWKETQAYQLIDPYEAWSPSSLYPPPGTSYGFVHVDIIMRYANLDSIQRRPK